MSPEEKSLLEEKIALSGLNKQDYMIQMSINHKVEVFGNIRAFDELKTKLKMLEEYFKNVNLDCNIEENKLELLAYILKMFETVNRNKMTLPTAIDKAGKQPDKIATLESIL
mgnify:CR=1 FL=1